MKVLAKREYGDGTELWFGIPSWDPLGRGGEMSVKFAYRTNDGQRWARTSPEVPESVVWDMVVMLNEHGRLHEILRRAAASSPSTVRQHIGAVITTLQRALNESP